MNIKELYININKDLRKENIESSPNMVEIDLLGEEIEELEKEMKVVVKFLIEVKEQELEDLLEVIEDNFLEEYVLAIYSAIFHESGADFLKYFKKVINLTSISLEKRLKEEMIYFLENKNIPKSFIDKYSIKYARLIQKGLLETKEKGTGIFIQMLVDKITSIYQYRNRKNKNKYDELRFKKARENLLTLFYQYGGDISHTGLAKILFNLLK